MGLGNYKARVLGEPERELLQRCADKGYTPGARDVDALVGLWRALSEGGARKAELKQVVKALCRGELGVARGLERGYAELDPAERAMRLQVLGRIGRRMELPGLAERLESALRDPHARVVREAARVIGKLPEAVGQLYEDELVRVLGEAALPEQRAAVEALGLVGGPRAQTVLAQLHPENADLARRVARAQALLERRAGQDEPAQLQLDHAAGMSLRVILRCRGVAQLVAREAREVLGIEGLEQLDARTLRLNWSRPLAQLQQLRTPLEWGLVFELPPGASLRERVLAGLAQPELVRALQRHTDGPLRFRLSFARRGSQRALAWEVAAALAGSDSPLRNDPRSASWTVEVDEGRAQLLCLPKFDDRRFDYRVADIPAASHPTMAALMARVAAPQQGERVWDPYCGSGVELIECSRLAPGLRLLGSDRNPQAIAAARANFEAAGIGSERFTLRCSDALLAAPDHADIIITNPPMGRRAAVEGGGLHGSLRAFIEQAARRLSAGGRLVWVTPAARATRAAGQAVGLQVRDHGEIDMSGLRVVVQVMRPSQR